MNADDQSWMRRAIQLADTGAAGNFGGPFGAVVVRDGMQIAEGFNRVLADRDPTAHGEIVAIRAACQAIGSHQLSGCTLYTSCEPCPMCLAAIYWSRLDRLVYGCGHDQAAAIGFDDNYIYEQIPLPPGQRRLDSSQVLESDAAAVMRRWGNRPDRQLY